MGVAATAFLTVVVVVFALVVEVVGRDLICWGSSWSEMGPGSMVGGSGGGPAIGERRSVAPTRTALDARSGALRLWTIAAVIVATHSTPTYRGRVLPLVGVSRDPAWSAADPDVPARCEGPGTPRP